MIRRLNEDSLSVFTLAGVPGIMRGMLQDIGRRIEGGATVHSISVPAEGIGEGDAAEPLAKIEKLYPDVSIGSYPYFEIDRRGVNFVARSRNAHVLDDVELVLKNLALSLKVDLS